MAKPKGKKAPARKLSPARAQELADLVAVLSGIGGTTGAASGRIAGAGGGGHKGVLDALKDVGGTALHALSVPSAVVETTAANIGHAINPDIPGQSWHDLKGTFSDTYKPGDAYTSMYKEAGLTGNWAKIAGIGTNIIADPLWLVGGGAARKLGMLSRLPEGHEAVRAIATRTNALKEGEKAGETLKTISKSGTLNPETGLIDPLKQKAMFDALSEHGTRMAESAKAGFVPVVRVGTKSHNLEIPLRLKPIMKKTDAQLTRGRTFGQAELRRQATLLRNRAADTVGLDTVALAKYFEKMGVKPGGAEDTMLRLVSSAYAKDKAAGDSLIRDLRRRGEWEPRHQKVLDAVANLGKSQAAAEGVRTYEESAKLIDNALKAWHAQVADEARPHILHHVADESARLKSRLGLVRRRIKDAERRTGLNAADGHFPELTLEVDDLTRQLRSLAAKGRMARRPGGALTEDAMALVPETVRNAQWKRFVGELRQQAKNTGHAKIDQFFAKGKGQTTLKDLEAIRDKWAATGPYFPQVQAHETAQAIRDWAIKQKRDKRLVGQDVNVIGKSGEESLLPNAEKAREFQNITEATTYERNVARSIANGMPPEQAEFINGRLAEIFGGFAPPKGRLEGVDDLPTAAVSATGFAGKESHARIPYDPELSLFRSAELRQRENKYIMSKQALEKTLRRVFDKEDFKGMVEDLNRSYHTERIPGYITQAFGVTKDGRDRLPVVTSWLKAWFTTLNPAHYVLNATGAYINDLIKGNWRHAARGFKTIVPRGSDSWRIAAGPGKHAGEFMEKQITAGGVTMSGAEWMFATRMSGLGHGYSQSDVIDVIAALDEIGQGTHKTGKWGKYGTAMTRLNMNRENAFRVESWMNHMRAGDDPLTAGAKVLRTQFNYDELSHFEKNVVRQLVFFYTWFKNNAKLQGYGILTRPGIYATMGKLEATRPKSLGEPEWMSKAGGLYTPWGLMTFGNPMADIYKYDLSWENFRKNVVGALNPMLLGPLEVAAGKDMFTGAQLPKFEGQQTPSPLWSALSLIGYEGQSRKKAGGELAPAGPWQASHLFNKVLGPIGGQFRTQLDPDYGDKSRTLDILGRTSGLRINQPETEKWLQQQRVQAIRKKGDATRKRNYEAPNG